MQTYDIFIVFILLIVIEESLCFMRCKIPHSNVCTKMTISGISNDLAQKFIEIDKRTHDNMKKILDFYREERVDSTCFHGVNGYGYGDYGREKFDRIVAKIMGAEDALVRLQFFSGTHAIACALFSCLRSGDTMLAVSGQPYDTLEEVIGLRDGSQTGSKCGSLFDWGISYEQIDLKYECTENKVSSAFEFDLAEIDKRIQQNPSIKLIHVQRSCGYQWRPSIKIAEIARLCSHIKSHHSSNIVIFVDNCYGELVEEYEPCHVGADLVAGSLIKNLGGTLSPSGGYVAGRKDLVAAASVRLSAPGVEGGATFNQYKNLFQGLFLAPTIVGESLKGAELIASTMSKLGYPCNPPPNSVRTDIIQAVQFGDEKKLVKFCEKVQLASPVGAYIVPIPGETSGYGGNVIFADGTFVEGSTLELSADGPLRDPFVAYTQGCTHWTHWQIVLESLLNDVGSFQA